MALSFYNSNWDPLQQHNYPEITNDSFPPPELDMALLDFQENLFNPDYLCSIDHLLEPNHDLIFPSHDNSIPQEFHSDLFQYPKRQKCYEDNYCYYYGEDLTGGSFDSFIPNPPLLPEFLHLPLPEFSTPMRAFDYGCGEATSEIRASGSSGGGSLSAQSIAARQRRRKITDKTQELGKLIPGGHKMNTAEMFHAASKYIKFLQAQVGILEFMGSTQENDEPVMHTRELQTFASSPSIQEKLYSSETCLVPKEFVETLANDPQLHSNSLISNDLLQLIHPNQ